MMKKTKDYKSEYAQKLVAWFRDAPLFVEETKEVFSKKSDKIETIIEKQPAPCPSVVRFADNLKINVEDILRWREKNFEFKSAYEQAMYFREEWLMNAAGLGFYNSSMSIMALKANHGWSEKSEKQLIDDGIKQVLVQFVKDKGENYEKNNGENSANICSANDEKISD